MRERYETLINRRKYTFDLNHDGFTWIARAFRDDRCRVVAVSSGDNSEVAALNLVHQVEIIKFNRK